MGGGAGEALAGGSSARCARCASSSGRPLQRALPRAVPRRAVQLHPPIAARLTPPRRRPCHPVLKLSPGDEDALRCKVVALISEGEWEEAGKVLAHKRLEGKMQFERVSGGRGHGTSCLWVYDGPWHAAVCWRPGGYQHSAADT